MAQPRPQPTIPEHTSITVLTLAIPDSALSALRRSPAELGQELKLAAAMHWYGRGLMSQERAAELAGLTRRDFIHALARDGQDVFVLDDDSFAQELGQTDDEAVGCQCPPRKCAW